VAAAIERFRALHGHTRAGQSRDEAVETVDGESRMRFARRPEVGLDAEVDPDCAGLEPAATASGETLGLGDARDPEQALVKDGGSCLLAGRHGQLDVVEGANRHRPIVTPAPVSGASSR